MTTTMRSETRLQEKDGLIIDVHLLYTSCISTCVYMCMMLVDFLCVNDKSHLRSVESLAAILR